MKQIMKDDDNKPFDWVLYDEHCNKVKKHSQKSHKFEQFELVKIIKGSYKRSVGEIADYSYDTRKNRWCFHVKLNNANGSFVNDLAICYEDQLKSSKNFQFFVQVYNYDDTKPLRIVKSLNDARKIAESSIDDDFFGAEIYEVDPGGKMQKFQTYDRYHCPGENKWSDL